MIRRNSPTERDLNGDLGTGWPQRIGRTVLRNDWLLGVLIITVGAVIVITLLAVLH